MALPAEARNMKVKTKLPVPAVAASGRWIKGADGEWGFDFDDDVPKTKTSDDDDEYEADNAVTYTDNMNNRNQQPNLGDVAKTMSSSNTNKGSIASQPSHVQSGSSSPAKPKNITSINLVLRMRDEKKELQDIKFEFLPNKDTVDEISHELVNAKLIDAIDMIAVSANLNKILENHALSPITFPLVS